MYSFGMTNRDIKAHLEKIYNVEVSPDLISRVTNAVLDDVKEWQSRVLEKTYAILYLDAIMIKGKFEGKSCNRTVYVALEVNMEGKKGSLRALDSRNRGCKAMGWHT